MKNVVILGGGLTGLVLADLLSDDDHHVTVLEKEPVTGGMCISKSRCINGFELKYDLGPHKFATFDEKVKNYFLGVVEHPCVVYKSSHIWLKGQHLKYPVRITEIIKKMPDVGMRCALGYIGAILKFDGKTYDKYMRKRFGDYVYELVFEGYARKVWGEPTELDCELGRTRMVATSLIDMLIGMLTDSGAQSFGNFFYSGRGIGDMTDSIRERALSKGADIKTDVSGIVISGTTVIFNEGENIKSLDYDVMISTVPPVDLAYMLKIDTDDFENIGYRDLKLHYYLFDKKRVDFKDTWRFFPEESVVFNRLSKNWSPSMVPDGTMCICAETTLPVVDKDVDREVLDYLGLSSNDVIDSWTDWIEGAYPIYHVGFKHDVEDFLDVFEAYGVYCIGRHACHNYNNMDHTMAEAMDLTDIIKTGGSVEKWREKMSTYDWKIVD